MALSIEGTRTHVRVPHLVLTHRIAYLAPSKYRFGRDYIVRRASSRVGARHLVNRHYRQFYTKLAHIDQCTLSLSLDRWSDSAPLPLRLHSSDIRIIVNSSASFICKRMNSVHHGESTCARIEKHKPYIKRRPSRGLVAN